MRAGRRIVCLDVRCQVIATIELPFLRMPRYPLTEDILRLDEAFHVRHAEPSFLVERPGWASVQLWALQ